jgi:uncharacterized membrane protein
MHISEITPWTLKPLRGETTMVSTNRLLTKAVPGQIAGFFTMMLIGFLFTGSVTASSGIAFVGALTGFASYFVHEMVWSRVSWGRSNVHAVD